MAWHGVLLPVDHVFWQTHFPINGWGCKCRVRQVSKVEAQRLGQDGVRAPVPEQERDPDTKLPTGHLKQSRVPVRTQAPAIRRREWINKRTGEVNRVPEGIDPGWDYNPGVVGRLPASLDQAAQKLAVADRSVAAATARQMAGGASFKEWARKPQGDFPIGVLGQQDAELIQAKAHVVRLSPDTLAKQQSHHPELSTQEYAYVQDALDRGERIQDGGTSLIYILDDDAGYVTVVKATRSGKAVFLQSFRRLSRDQAKRDAEVRRLRAKKQ